MRVLVKLCGGVSRGCYRLKRAYGIEAIERAIGQQAARRIINSIENHQISINSPTTTVADPSHVQTWEWVAGLDCSPKYTLEELKLIASQSVDPFQLVQEDVSSLSGAIKDLLGSDHPVLESCAKYFFEADGGKKIRPAMVIAVSYALNAHLLTMHPSDGSVATAESPHRPFLGATASQKRLAEITEMIHTASLFHDDVIDKASTRRGVPSVNQVFGNKLAILGGDFLLSRASVSLARMRNVEVVELLSTVIEHLVKGEIMQMRPSPNVSPLEYYLRKNFYKTASLMGHSCLAAAVLGGHTEECRKASYLYGTYVGQAFQLVDDALDFEGSTASIGKAPLADLKSGLATAPTLFAAEEFPQLTALIARKFESPGDIDEALRLVQSSQGLRKCKELAQVHAEKAIEAILTLEPSQARDALVSLACKVVIRTH